MGALEGLLSRTGRSSMATLLLTRDEETLVELLSWRSCSSCNQEVLLPLKVLFMLLDSLDDEALFDCLRGTDVPRPSSLLLLGSMLMPLLHVLTLLTLDPLRTLDPLLLSDLFLFLREIQDDLRILLCILLKALSFRRDSPGRALARSS